METITPAQFARDQLPDIDVVLPGLLSLKIDDAVVLGNQLIEFGSGPASRLGPKPHRNTTSRSIRLARLPAASRAVTR